MDKTQMDGFLVYRNWYYYNEGGSQIEMEKRFGFSFKECSAYHDLIVKYKEEWIEYIEEEYGPDCEPVDILFENKFYE
jgi:hypothetical protein